ncbi:hypothetical protein [Bacillus sp. 105MF]|uniref:hypothetical protein n=1 Tax=Bacillus sp. 105MF TaxID=1151120 RepID=UPI0003660FC3|nr:hypothetical protein [Bacillus sp. 105MF]
MRDIAKMKKGELKDLLIEQLITIKDLIQWSEDNKVPGLFGSLIIDSGYAQNRSLIDPDDYTHKIMKKDNYLYDIRNFQILISKLGELKDEYERGNLIQSEKASTIDVIESNLNQANIEDNEKSNLIQSNNENSNQNQSKRGGKRVGAGRKGFGETRKVSLTLTPETWSMIEELCEKGNLKQSKVLRDIIEQGIK